MEKRQKSTYFQEGSGEKNQIEDAREKQIVIALEPITLDKRDKTTTPSINRRKDIYSLAHVTRILGPRA